MLLQWRWRLSTAAERMYFRRVFNGGTRRNAVCRPAGPLRYCLPVILLVCFGVTSVSAKDGRFEIHSAESRVVDGIWLVDARIDLELSRETKEALENGIALTLQMQFEVNRYRRFWPDRTILKKSENIEIRYMSLSQRYVVNYINTGKQVSFATLYSALRSIGQLRDFALIDEDRVDSRKVNLFSMRIVLDRENLPGPLQMLAFWRGDFSLESDWYRWKSN
jgi:hypothetical protein